MIKTFPVVIISGARQVGKSTLAIALQKDNEIKYNYLTLDNPLLREEAKRDPQLFLEKNQAPVIIDYICAGIFSFQNKSEINTL
ncbi:MAG: AAA family ATPase [Erysipelotrichales bacterium]|nr:AAA family ATPase [Erysipelotrichales bacterium]